MKQINLLFLTLLILVVTACQSLNEPELSSSNTLSSIECVVVMQEKNNDMGKPDDVKQIFQGSISSNGIITFSGISDLSSEQKSRARFTAIIPQTATLIEKDGADNVIGNGIGGQRSVSKKTYYFYVVAADGQEKKYVLTFN